MAAAGAAVAAGAGKARKALGRAAAQADERAEETAAAVQAAVAGQGGEAMVADLLPVRAVPCWGRWGVLGHACWGCAEA